ncbi:hypothetical protein ITP53_51115, partial [Nonomuraea sp. K274]|nr:hypothetical protein [Nonomuraea cypriaca]
MAGGRGDVNSQTPGGLASDDGFGGVSATDVQPVWETEALPGWVNDWLIPMLASGQSWPKASESGLWQLREAHRLAMNSYADVFEPAGSALRAISTEWDSPARPAAFSRIGEMFDDQSGAMSKMAAHYQYARQADAFALETQYSKIAINVAFWVTIVAISIALIAAFFSAGAAATAAGPAATGLRAAIGRILTRLGLVAARPAGVAATGRLAALGGTSVGTRLASAALVRELVEEIGEEVFIDAYAQYKQIQMGTRTGWDWDKTMASALGAGVGAVVGTKLGGPVSRLTNSIPGIGRLNRTAADLPGWGNAFRRFPGRVLNTGLNNVVASPAGSFVSNGLVYGQWAPPTAESLVGGFMGGAGRTNTISPFDPSVAGALLNPGGALNSVADSAAATHLARTEPATTGGGPNVGLQAPVNGSPGGSQNGSPSGGPSQPGGPVGVQAQQGGPAQQGPSVPAPRAGSPAPADASPLRTSGTTAAGPDQQRSTAQADPDEQRPDVQTDPDQQRPGAQTDPGEQRPAAQTDPGEQRPDAQADRDQAADSREARSGQTAQQAPGAPEEAAGDQQRAASQDTAADERDAAPSAPADRGESAPRSIDELLNGTHTDAAPAATSNTDTNTGTDDGQETRNTGATSGDTRLTTVSSLDHATRTPYLNVDPPPGAAAQRHANAYEPRAVPLALQWDGLRRSAEPARVTVSGLPATGLHPDVEVRRLLVPWRGAQRTVTEFTVRVYYRADPGVTAEEIATAHDSLLMGVDLYYNYQHELPDGSQLHVRMEFSPAPGSAPDGKVVRLHSGTGTRGFDFADRQSWYGAGEVITTPLDQMASYRHRAPIDYMSWYAGMEPVLFAHETMHLFGLFDEYVDPNDPNRRNLATPDVRADANLLGAAVLMWAQGRPMLDRDGHVVPEAAGLRDRHLLHLFELVPQNTGSPKVPLVRPATRGNAEEWSRPDYDPAAHLPGDVRGLLDAFPSDGRPLAEHLRRLERMNVLFGDARNLTPDHLAYTDALVTMAQDLYGTGPEYSFSADELTSLRRLSTLLLGDTPPRTDLLQEQVNALLGRDPATRADNRQTQVLATLATTVSPRPGESGADTLRRAIEARRRSMQGIIELRRAGITLPPANSTTNPAANTSTPAPTATSPGTSTNATAGTSGTSTNATAGDEDSTAGLRAGVSAPPPNPDGAPASSNDPRQFRRFWRHLMSQVQAEARRRGTAPLDELQQFTLQRALARIFAANPDDWMLKGGQAMLSRNPGGRASTDIDLVRMSGDSDPDAMADEYEAALARDHGDHLRFVRESKVYILHGKAVRMAHKVYCGDMEIM